MVLVKNLSITMLAILYLLVQLPYYVCAELAPSMQNEQNNNQWHYLHQAFNKEQKNCMTLSNKTGWFLQENSAHIAAPLAIVIALQLAVVASTRSLISSTNRNLNFFVGGLLGGTLAYGAAYKLLAALGHYLHNKPSVDSSAILSFVAQLHEHKNSIPQEYHAMFDELCQYLANNEALVNDSKIPSLLIDLASLCDEFSTILKNYNKNLLPV